VFNWVLQCSTVSVRFPYCIKSPYNNYDRPEMYDTSS